MNCAEAETVLPVYSDGEITEVDRGQIERHLATCAACASRTRLQARFKAAVRAHLPRPPVPQELRVRLRAVLGEREIAPRRWFWATHPRLVPAAVPRPPACPSPVTHPGYLPPVSRAEVAPNRSWRDHPP